MEKIESVDELRQALQDKPDDITSALRLGQYYADQGWFNQSIDVYKDALKHHPEDYSLLLDYGNVCYKRQDYKEAQQCFEKLTNLKPMRIEGWNNLGIVYLALKEDEQAKGCFERVLSIEPENPGALLNMGNYFQNKNEILQAMSFFSRCVKVQPDFIDGWFNLGNAQIYLKQYTQSIYSFEKALRYQREFPSALKNLGYAYECCNNFVKAEECYIQASELNKADASIHANLANLYLKLDRVEDARRCYLKAVRLAPRDTKGWLGLREVALLKGDIRTYVRATLSIISHLDPDDIALCIWKLREIGHEDKALEILTHADRLGKDSDSLDALRLALYTKKSINRDKIGPLQKKLSLIQNKTALINKGLAEFEHLSANFKKAIEIIKQIENPDLFCLNLFWRSLAALNFADELKKSAQTYAERHPDCFDAWYMIARAASMMRDEETVRECMIKALECGFSEIDDLEADPLMLSIIKKLAPELQAHAD